MEDRRNSNEISGDPAVEVNIIDVGANKEMPLKQDTRPAVTQG